MACVSLLVGKADIDWTQHRCAVSTESETSVKGAYFFVSFDEGEKGKKKRTTCHLLLVFVHRGPWPVADPSFLALLAITKSPNPHVSAPSADADGLSEDER